MVDASARYAFLSYSRRDQAFAARLAKDLRARGIRLWFDQLDIPPGTNWDESIQRALHGASAVLFVVSDSSVASPNVLNELAVALDTDKWIIPLMIANVQVPLRIVRLQRVDFVRDYATGVAQLVAYMIGGGSRTAALDAIATAAPSPYTPTASPVPVDFTSGRSVPNDLQSNVVQPRRSASWVLPAIFGGAVAATALIVGLIFLAGALSANDDATKLGQLQGNWASNCVTLGTASKKSAIFVFGSVMTVQEFNFSSTICAELRYSSTTVWDIVAMNSRGDGLYALDYRLRTIDYTPITIADAFNGDNYLGYRQWRDNATVRLSQAAIEQVYPGMYPGATIYDLASIQANVLSFGATRDGRPATTPRERPLVIAAGQRFLHQ
jgi:hypothetical protein